MRVAVLDPNRLTFPKNRIGWSFLNPHLPEWRNWQTRQLEGLVGLQARAGSSPVSGIDIKRAQGNCLESFFLLTLLLVTQENTAGLSGITVDDPRRARAFV